MFVVEIFAHEEMSGLFRLRFLDLTAVAVALLIISVMILMLIHVMIFLTFISILFATFCTLIIQYNFALSLIFVLINSTFADSTLMILAFHDDSACPIIIICYCLFKCQKIF